MTIRELRETVLTRFSEQGGRVGGIKATGGAIAATIAATAAIVAILSFLVSRIQ